MHLFRGKGRQVWRQPVKLFSSRDNHPPLDLLPLLFYLPKRVHLIVKDHKLVAMIQNNVKDSLCFLKINLLRLDYNCATWRFNIHIALRMQHNLFRRHLNVTTVAVFQSKSARRVIKPHALSARRPQRISLHCIAIDPPVPLFPRPHAVQTAKDDTLRRVALWEQHKHGVLYIGHRQQALSQSRAGSNHTHPIRFDIIESRKLRLYTPKPFRIVDVSNNAKRSKARARTNLPRRRRRGDHRYEAFYTIERMIDRGKHISS